MGRFLVVEGLIGAGKTTLCRLLEREWSAKLILEPAESNPFLETFYADPERYALPVQMFYLINRWRQQAQIRQGDLFTEMVVSDYVFAKDRLFAEKTLNEEELALYDLFLAALNEQAPTPDLIIWIEVPIETVMSRIARRGAPGETAISEEYLEDLRARYHALWNRWTACPILRLENQDLNYADDPSAMEEVQKRIRAALDGLPESPTPGPDSLGREVQPSLFVKASESSSA